MANIGATTAFYKVETSLTRANNEVSKSMERLATGKQNATAGDRSSYQAMADTFRLDYVATKAGLKGASVVMGYLETAMRTLDAAYGVLSRLQELAVLGANETNTSTILTVIFWVSAIVTLALIVSELLYRQEKKRLTLIRQYSWKTKKLRAS